MSETILEAAILYNSVVYTGKRHCNIIREIVKKTGAKRVKGEQGFVTTSGRFVNRLEAAKIAIDSNQIEKLNWPPKLYSEDLY